MSRNEHTFRSRSSELMNSSVSLGSRVTEVRRKARDPRARETSPTVASVVCVLLLQLLQLLR